uniref:RAP domain-containing protein n=2 Tax=Tetradesmus obliquus TaxID=3088 RepID=A0A383VC34_TETOB|eukprot:jgi/Sobl393_1/17755/SZX63137.1
MTAYNLPAAILKLSKLKCGDPRPYAACMQRYMRFYKSDSARHLSNVVYGLCTAPAAITRQHQAALQQQLMPAFVAKLPAVNAQDISNVLYGMAVSGQLFPDEVVQRLMAAFVDQLQHAKPQNVSNTLWAVATMGQTMPDWQLQQLLGVFVSILQQAKPQEVSNTLLAVAKMGQTAPAGQLQQLLAAIVSMLQQAKPQEVSNTLLACAKLCFLPQQLLAAPGLAGLLLADTPQGLANAAWACGQLGHRDEQLMAALLAEVTQRLGAALDSDGSNCDEFTSQALCNVCWAVAVLDLQQHAQQVLQLAQACSSIWAGMVTENFQQLWQVHTCLLDFQLAGGQGLQGSLTEQQLQQCRAAWDHSMQATAKQRHAEFQCAVFAAVQQLPIVWQQQPQMEQPSVGRDGVTPDGALLLDIAGRTAAGVLVAVEADGPWHFRQPDGGLMGTTQYKNKALPRRGYRLVSVPWWERDELHGDVECQKQYLMRLLEEAGVVSGQPTAPPGEEQASRRKQQQQQQQQQSTPAKAAAKALLQRAGLPGQGTSSLAEKPVGLQQQAAPTAKPGSLIAIADLHGDVDKARKALQLVSVVDSQGRWSAEGVTVVQLGDLVDRGPSSLEVVRYMHSLQDQALQHNSRLVLLLGNHELLNLHGDFRYVAPEELMQLGKQQQQQQQQQHKHMATVASSSQVMPAAGAAAAAEGPPTASQHESASASYLAGQKAWAALWSASANQAPPASSAAASGAGAALAAASNGGDSSNSSTTDPAAAAAEGAAGSVRAAVVDRHQLLAVFGRGGPCTTAFVHAGLIAQALHELLLISNSTNGRSSSSTADAAPGAGSSVIKPQPLNATAATANSHNSLHHRVHERTLGAAGSSSSSSSSAGAAAGSTSAGGAVPVGVVSAEELQGVNNVVRQALQHCRGDRACAGAPAHLQRASAVLGAAQGPVWSRQQAQGREGSVCRHLEQVLARLDVRRLVVGHTPQSSGRAAVRCEGKLLLLDTGMSSGMMGSPAAAWLCHAGDAQGSTAGGGLPAADAQGVGGKTVLGQDDRGEEKPRSSSRVLQLAAANVVDGVLAARTGSKAVTAAIDTLQAGGIAGFRAPRVRAPPGGPKRDRSRIVYSHVVQQGRPGEPPPPQHQPPLLLPQQQQQQPGQHQPGEQQTDQQMPLLMLLNQQLQQTAVPEQQEQQQQHLSMLTLISQQQQQLAHLMQPGVAVPAGVGTFTGQQGEGVQQPMQAAQQQQQHLEQQQQPSQQQAEMLAGQKHQVQLQQQQLQQGRKRHKQHACEDEQHAAACAAAAGGSAAAAAAAAAAAVDASAATGDAASGSADSQQLSTPWKDHGPAAAAAAAAAAAGSDACPAALAHAPLQQAQPAAAHAGAAGSHKARLQPLHVAPRQQPHQPPAVPDVDASRGCSELLWRYQRAQLAYNATVAAAAVGDTAPSSAAAAAAGRFELPWVKRQPWEWEWEQRQQQSPRAAAAAGILMSLAGESFF